MTTSTEIQKTKELLLAKKTKIWKIKSLILKAKLLAIRIQETSENQGDVLDFIEKNE